MDLPHTKLPIPSQIKLTNGIISGKIDFSESLDPFAIYIEDWKKSPHLEFVKIGDDPQSLLAFVKKWGPLDYWAYKKDDNLTPTLLSLSHSLHREIKLLREASFNISIKRLLHFHAQIRAVLMLWKAFRNSDPAGIEKALDEWLYVYKKTIKDLALTPVPLPLSSPKDRLTTLDRLHPGDLNTLAGAALARSFAWSLRSPLYAPVLCLEPIYYIGPKLRVKDLTGNRLHYHIKDILSAMWIMIFSDVAKGLSQQDCRHCGRVFRLKRVTQLFCSKKCADAHRSKINYWKNKADAKRQLGGK